VFIVDQSGLARLRLIKTGRAFGERLEILSGLNAGEEVLIEGPPTIQDGTRVREAAPVKGPPITTR
jgi:hypothetical protein